MIEKDGTKGGAGQESDRPILVEDPNMELCGKPVNPLTIPGLFYGAKPKRASTEQVALKLLHWKIN